MISFIRRNLFTITAWIGTAFILGYIFVTTDFQEGIKTILQADKTLFVITALISTPLVWLLDGIGAWVVIAKTGLKPRLSDFLIAKGASYLPNIINYNLGLTMIALVVARKSEKGIVEIAGSFILLNLVDLGVMAGLMMCTVFLGFSPFEHRINLSLVSCSMLAILVLPIIIITSNTKSKFLAFLTNSTLFKPFRGIKIRDLWTCFPARVLLISVYAITSYFFLKALGFLVPLEKVFVFTPILGFIGVIPISISGLGSTQVVAREFYAKYAPAGCEPIPAVDAYTTASIISVLIIRIIIALLCLPFALRFRKSSG